jgi:hypothetical protein
MDAPDSVQALRALQSPQAAPPLPILDPTSGALQARPAFPEPGEDRLCAESAGQNDTSAPADVRKDLTARQAAFAAHYVACGNGAEAARRAGYSIDNARYIVRDNLRKDGVRQRIRALAAAREEQRRDEAGYLVMMLNAAMELALQQGQPAAMIRALAHMARLTGLDRPSQLSSLAADTEVDGDAAVALAQDDRSGLIQEAVLSAAQSAERVPETGGETGGQTSRVPTGDTSRVPTGDTTKAHKTPHPGICGADLSNSPFVAPALSRGADRPAPAAGGSARKSPTRRPEVTVS